MHHHHPRSPITSDHAVPPDTTAPPVVDTLVVGGGPAGCAAALVLARARHDVVVVDDGSYRNAAVDEFHGFPTRDRTAPDAYRADARRELAHYGVRFTATPVVGARRRATSAGDRPIEIDLAGGSTVVARSVVIATGVRDDLPPIAGLRERWGRSAFNCPFCDGWEHRDQPVVVIDAAPGAEHLAGLLRSWTDDVTVVGADQVVALAGTGTGLDHVVLRDGRRIAAAAAFVKAPVVPRSALAADLGCALDADGFVLTDPSGRTTAPRVWAAGDVRRSPPAPHQVVLAAADGSAAAIALHKAFVGGELEVGGHVEGSVRA